MLNRRSDLHGNWRDDSDDYYNHTELRSRERPTN